MYIYRKDLVHDVHTRWVSSTAPVQSEEAIIRLKHALAERQHLGRREIQAGVFAKIFL